MADETDNIDLGIEVNLKSNNQGLDTDIQKVADNLKKVDNNAEKAKTSIEKLSKTTKSK